MARSSVVASLEWKHGLRFKASAEGRELVLDGERRAGFSPTEALSLALAGCMAIDVVVILKKRRATIDALRVRIEGTRAETEPRRFTRLRLGFELAGSGRSEEHTSEVQSPDQFVCRLLLVKAKTTSSLSGIIRSARSSKRP